MRSPQVVVSQTALCGGESDGVAPCCVSVHSQSAVRLSSSEGGRAVFPQAGAGHQRGQAGGQLVSKPPNGAAWPPSQ